jgi:hypothetical protein
VRNYARQVRQRLDHYFEEEGKLEELRISIPLGKYIPVFTPNRSPEPISIPIPGRREEMVPRCLQLAAANLLLWRSRFSRIPAPIFAHLLRCFLSWLAELAYGGS